MVLPINSTGDEDQTGILKQLLSTLLRKDTVEKPLIYSAGGNILTHFNRVEDYFKSIHVTDDETKCALLFGLLSENINAELKCLPEYKTTQPYSWIKQQLIKLFGRQSEVTPLVKLLDTKQKDGQSRREFISELRIQGYYLLTDKDSNEREKLLVDAFLNGIMNKNLSIALTSLKPKTLDDAFKLAKKENNYSEENKETVLRYFQPNDKIVNNQLGVEIKSIQQDLIVLKNQINILLNYVTNSRDKNQNLTQNRQYEQRRYYNEKMPQKRRQYFNPLLNKNRDKITCFKCQRPGHIARFCRNEINNYRVKNTRQINNEEQDRHSCTEEERESVIGQDFFMVNMNERKAREDKEGFILVKGKNRENSRNTGHEGKKEQINFGFKYDRIFNETNSKIDNCEYALTKSHKQTEQKDKRQQLAPTFVNNINDPYVQTALNYINNDTKPTKTVITQSHPEKAANKPIIRGKLNNKLGKMFCDSGCEINLIDYVTARKFVSINTHVKILKENILLKCANGSQMKTRGKIFLRLNIGGVESNQEFILVDNLFPRVIIGIRTMKDMCMKLNLNEDGAEINNKIVPFISKTELPSFKKTEN